MRVFEDRSVLRLFDPVLTILLYLGSTFTMSVQLPAAQSCGAIAITKIVESDVNINYTIYHIKNNNFQIQYILEVKCNMLSIVCQPVLVPVGG